MKTIILDAYNVIFAIHELRHQMQKKPELARKSLLIDCLHYKAMRKDVDKIIIVFDGREDFLDLPRFWTEGIEEIYTRAGEEADHRIVDILHAEEDLNHWVVISADNYVRNHARSSGAKVMSSIDFYNDFKARKEKFSASPTKSFEESKISGKEADSITKEYGDYLGVQL